MASRHLLVEPKTDAQLFDMIHGLFGVGDFDDSGPVPWFKHRMTEINKLKAMRKKRQVPLPDVAVAARYCYRHHVAIRQSYQLFPHITEAKRDARNRRITDIAQEIAMAISNERSRADTDHEWIGRLLRARGDYRREVLEEWTATRGPR